MFSHSPERVEFEQHLLSEGPVGRLLICHDRTSASTFSACLSLEYSQLRLVSASCQKKEGLSLFSCSTDAGQGWYQILPLGCYDEPTAPGKGHFWTLEFFWGSSLLPWQQTQTWSILVKILALPHSGRMSSMTGIGKWHLFNARVQAKVKVTVAFFVIPREFNHSVGLLTFSITPLVSRSSRYFSAGYLKL